LERIERDRADDRSRRSSPVRGHPILTSILFI